MLHEPAAPVEKDEAIPYKMRIGLVMFIFYAVIYAGFVAINVLKPILMESIILAGLNLAVVYGFGLIVLALILALIYNMICTKKEKHMNEPSSEKKSN